MANITKPLTNTEVKQAKAKEKEYNLADGQGLALRVRPILSIDSEYILTQFTYFDYNIILCIYSVGVSSSISTIDDLSQSAKISCPL